MNARPAEPSRDGATLRTRRMRKFTFAALVAALTLTAGLALAQGPNIGTAISQRRTTDQQRADIRYQRVDRVKWTTREVVRTIRAAVQRWPVEGGASKAIAVARCESGLYWHASNGGGYLGVFQQSARYWPARQNAYDSRRWHLGERAWNARANVIVSIRQAHANGWGAWGCA